ncbi:diacylglycerol kinase [Ewingella sp. S1.OA.A_B6]
MKNESTGFTRIVKAAGFSLKGLSSAWKNEAAFRQEVIGVFPFIILSFFLDVTSVERILLVGVLGLVIIVELLNSAVECAIDRIGPEFHVLSGRAKDIGSAAVLLTIILAVFTWVSVFWPHWF